MRLKIISLALLAMAWLAIPSFSLEVDDTILLEQIQVAVSQYRRIAQDFEHLKASLRDNPAVEGDIMDYPSVKEFLQVSVVPSESALRTLLLRYQDEHGVRALRKLAKRNQFSDILP